MTDDLIHALSADLKPVRRGAIFYRLFLAGLPALIISAVAMLVWLGLRQDIAHAVATPVFWLKFGYALAVAIFGILAVNLFARPGISGRAPLRAALGAFGVVALLAVLQLGLAAPEARAVLVMGSSALVCPIYILVLSLPFLFGNLLLMRHLAPTNLLLAGLAAGLMAGALGAWVYAFHCGEEGIPFLAIWYSIGMGAVAAIGAALGPVVLRW